mgnify:CR=1 FL=1
MSRPYRNQRLLARLAEVRCEMEARGEWRGLSLPDISPPAPLEDACASCGATDSARAPLADVTLGRGWVHLCATCLDKWEYSPRRRGRPPRDEDRRHEVFTPPAVPAAGYGARTGGN